MDSEVVNFHFAFPRLNAWDAGSRNVDDSEQVEDYLWVFGSKAIPSKQQRPDHWTDEAACQGMDPEVFDAKSAFEDDKAIQTCRGCPVRGDCLDVALSDLRIEGIWGGTTHFQRVTYAKEGVIVPPWMVRNSDRTLRRARRRAS